MKKWFVPMSLLALCCSSCSDEEVSEELESYSNSLKYCTIMSGDSNSWKDVKEIRYYFLNGTDSEKAEVKKAMLNWMAYGNVKFVEGNSRRNDVRIKFDYTQTSTGAGTSIGGYGFVGRDIKGVIAPDEAHVTIYPKVSNNIKMLALHELGHVLGFGDEIFNSNFPVKYNNWNFNNVYKDFYAGCGNSQQAQKQVNELQNNLLTAPANFYQRGSFDEKSIMMYKFNPLWCNNGYKYQTTNTELSDGDKEGIKKLYPLGNYVPVFVGSEGNNKAVLGRYDDFNDKSKIREFVGYGFEEEVAGTYLVTKFVNDAKECRMGIGRKNSSGTIVWDQGLKNQGFYPVSTQEFKPIYMYYSHGYGRTPVEVYYKNGKPMGYSYCFDSYLTDAGYTRPGSPLALATYAK